MAKLLAFDFDETIASGFPELEIEQAGGRTSSEWVGVIAIKAQSAGINTMLWTQRAGPFLASAELFLKARDIRFDWINSGPWWWRILRLVGLMSDKPPYDRLVDDRNEGTALIPGPIGKPCVDFSVEGPLVLEWIKGNANR